MTARQLRDAGLSKAAIARRVAKGLLALEHRGVYVVGHLADTTHGREVGALLAAGDRAVLSHRSAAKLHGLIDHAATTIPLAGAVDVTVPSHRRTERATVDVHRADLDPGEITKADGLPTTTIERTIQDLAATVARPELERLIAEARGKGVSVTAKGERRGAVALRAAVTGTTLTRSEAERAFLRLIRRAGIPAPETNVRVGRWEVDALWRAARIAVEIDSWAWHGTKGSFERDRRKDRALRAAGLTPVRVTASQIADEPEATAADLAAMLARAA